MTADWDFSGDETTCLLLASFASIVGATKWYAAIFRHRRPGYSASLLAAAPVACAAALYLALQRWADPATVAGHADYVTLFMVVGAAWTLTAAGLLAVAGISARADALERRNPAAATFIAGTMLAATALYAGANVGSGPTIWTTLVPALAGACLFTAALAALLTPTVADAIAIDRDVATALRNAGIAIAVGIIVGRAAAGDWTSWNDTFYDLARLSWPVPLLVAAGAAVNRRLRPTPARPNLPTATAGLLPALLFLLTAILWLGYLGPPQSAPHPLADTAHAGAQ